MMTTVLNKARHHGRQGKLFRITLIYILHFNCQFQFCCYYTIDFCLAETEEQASSSEDDPTTIGPMFAAMGALFMMFVFVAVYFKMKRRRSARKRRHGRGLSADDSRAGSAFSIGSAGSAASIGSMQSVASVGSMQSAASVAYDASTQSVMVGSHHSRY